MNIREFSYNLQKIYHEMSASFSSCQKNMGYSCLPSCGRCCLNPEIEASLFEMIPMALAIYEEGKMDEWIEKLSTSAQDYCLAFIPGEKEGEGQCVRYEERPSICRMFGVAGYRNKKNEVTLSICKFIKDHHEIKEIPINLNPHEVPMMMEWSYKLASLDQRLIQEKLPINKALMKALEKVALYAEYRQN
jgi:uncharacterized protein